MLTGVIENAQRRVEGRNFSIRKSVLNYDDVMNHQRETIYSERDMVLDGVDIRDRIIGMIYENIDSNVALFLADSEDHAHWNMAGLRSHYLGWLTSDGDLRYTSEQLQSMSREDVAQQLKDLALKKYEAKEQRLTPQVMRVLERLVLLRAVDSKWMDHIDNMDELRKGMHLRSYGRRTRWWSTALRATPCSTRWWPPSGEDTAKLVLTAEIVAQVRKDVESNARDAEAAHNAGASPAGRAKAAKKPGRNDPLPLRQRQEVQETAAAGPPRSFDGKSKRQALRRAPALNKRKYVKAILTSGPASFR